MYKRLLVWILILFVGEIAGEEHHRLRSEVRSLNNELTALKTSYETDIADLKKEISNLK